jgi:hypothetical protein
MKKETLIAYGIGIAALALVYAPAFAQSGETFKLHCHGVGYAPPEPLGDRKGHSISVPEYTCRVEGGPSDGGVTTGTGIWEWHGANAVLLSGMGVTRKPGVTLAYRINKENGALVMSDGKVTGFAGSGSGRYTMATGAAAALKGKPFSFTFKTTDPHQFVVDVTNE